MAATPSLVDAVRRAAQAELADVNVAIPARVESFDPTTQRCSAQPLIRRAYRDEAGERVGDASARLPVINDVPVVFPGAGAFSITFPVTKGDTVLLIFSQASIDKWLSRGDDVDPLDDRRHSLNDAIAIPGLRHRAEPTGGGGGGSAAPAALVITADDIRLGSASASDRVARESDLQQLRDIIDAALTGSGFGADLQARLASHHAGAGWPDCDSNVTSE